MCPQLSPKNGTAVVFLVIMQQQDIIVAKSVHHVILVASRSFLECYWETIVNRTYGIDKDLYIYLFLITMFGPIYYQVCGTP